MGKFEDLLSQGNSSSEEEKKKKTFEDLINQGSEDRKREEVSKVDDSYINRFFDNASSAFERAQAGYESMSWDNASSVLRRSQIDFDSMNQQRELIESWMQANRDYLDDSTYQSYLKELEKYRTDSVRVMHELSKAKDYYDPEKNPDGYQYYTALNYDVDGGQKKIDDLSHAMDLQKELEDDQYLLENWPGHHDWLEPSKEMLDAQAVVSRRIGRNQVELARLRETYGIQEGQGFQEALSSAKSDHYHAKSTKKALELEKQAMSDPDFEKHSADWDMVADRPDKGFIESLSIGRYIHDMGSAGEEEQAEMLGMTLDEFKVYKYYLNKDEASAQEYLDSIEYARNYKRGELKRQEEAEKGTLAQLSYFPTYGVDQFSSGMKGLWESVTGDSEYIPPSAIQFAGQGIGEDLSNTGPDWVGKTLKGVYDAGTTVANMAPSILASIAVGTVSKTAGAAVGKTLMGASAAGNAYMDKLNAGYSKDQARAYGYMVGISEVALESLLGGISAYGGSALSNSSIKMLNQIDNVLGDFARTAGGKLLVNATSEAIEEGIQSILEPYLWQAVSGEEANVDWQETLYSSLLGFVTGGIFEAAPAVGTWSANANAKKTYGSKQGALVNHVLELDPRSKYAKTMKTKVDAGKNLSGVQLSHLAEIRNDGIRDNVRYGFEERLRENGETGDVYAISEALAKKSFGEELTRAEKKLISNSEYAQTIAQELDADIESAFSEDGATESISPEEYSGIVKDAEVQVSDPEKTAKVEELKSEIASLQETVQNPDISAEEKAVATEQLEAAEQELKALESGTEEQAQTPGKKVKVTAKVASEPITLEEASQKYGAQAKAMVATYNKDQNVRMFDSAYSVAYEMGKTSNVLLEDALNSEATQYLTPEQREHAFNAGRSAAVARDKTGDQRAKASGKNVRREGRVSADDGLKMADLRKTFNDPQNKAYNTLVTIARVTGINIVLTKSKVDAQGRYVGDNGKYVWKDDTIYIDINAGLDYAKDAGEVTKYSMLRTFSHEFTHFLEKNAPIEYSALRDLVFAEMKARGENVDNFIRDKQTKYENISYEAASREVVADSMTDMLRDASFIEKLTQKHQTLAQKLLTKLKEFLANIKSYFAQLADNPSLEAKAIQQEIDGMMKYAESIIEAFDTAAVAAVENYQGIVTELTPGQEGVVVAEDGEPVAYSTEDGTVMLSIRTYEEEGRSAFRTYLEKCVKNKSLTETEMTEMLDGIEEVYNICKKFKDQYAPFSAWSDAEVIRDTHGKPVFSVVTPNGEYKMNLDFSLVCKKRRALDAVLNEMCKRGIIDNFELGPKTIVKINELIRKNKLETACSLCFVDAKRFRQADVADSVVRLYNELVQSLVPEEHSRSIDHFNFAGYRTITPTENGIHTWPNSKLDFSHINEVLKQYGKNTVEAKAARYIKNNPEGRRLLLREDFMSSSGFDAVKTQNPNIMKIYNSKKGTGGPKAAFGDVQYMNEIISNNKSWTPEKAYDVGGVRIQSFSDYVPRMVFDYVQMVYDLAAKKLPAHAYTKEALFVMQFGLTGIKINMSLIPAIVDGGVAPGLDANGDYAWAGESFDFDTAIKIQQAPGYTENCGTIAVGVSYEHIMKLLGDPKIRMVIPYHKSSLNPIVAHMNRIGKYTDYTKAGKTPVEHGGQRTTNKDGKTIEHEFNFAKTLHEVGDPKAVADQYLAWCDKEGYTPKFDEFRKHENYYKLLTDFTVYDESGNYVAQKEVKAVFPKKGNEFGEMEKLIESGLEEDAFIQSKRDSLIPKIVDEIERTIARTEAEISDTEQVEQADHDVEAELMDENRVQKSIRSYDSVEEMDSDYLAAVDSEDVKTQKQMVAEAAKRAMPDTVVVDTKGDLMLMYHGTANGGPFTVFEGNKLSNESRTSQIGQGFYFTNSKADAESYTKNVDIYGRASKGSNPHLHQVYLNITNPFDVRNDALDLDKVKSVYMDGGYDYFYDNWIPFYLDKKSVNGMTFTKADLKAMSREVRVSAFVDYYSKFGSKEVLSNMVRAFGSQNQGALLDSMKTRLGYDGIVEEYKPGLFQYVAFSSEQIKSADPVTYDDNGNVIPLSERFDDENQDIRYSKRIYEDDYAPTFYSQMEKVVSGMKQDKFGASSVVDMLRGRGVKAEEIKWSGIEAWLEGKKSVTKAELQEFIAGSMLQIEEETLDNRELPYSEEHQEQISKYEAERDIIVEQLKSEWKRIVGTDIPINYFGAGLESAVVNNLILVNKGKKDNTEVGYQHRAKRAALERVIEDSEDHFGFDNARQAFREAVKDPKGFMKAYELTAFEESVFKDFIKAKEAYGKVEGISIDDMKALKAIAESADRFSNRIVDVKNKHRSEAAKHLSKYRAYTIKGGTNYRELLFRIPESNYSNGAMYAHWERSGVLAHARIQDINTFLGKMLFIEEIQSDWHNEGRKTGYEGVPDAPFRDNYHEFVLKKLIRMAAEQGYDSIGWTPAKIQSERWSDEFAEGYRIEYDQDIPKFLNKYSKKWDTKVGKTVLDSGTEVWSMAITDAMKDSVLYEGQAQYQKRTNTLTDHEILDMAAKELDTSKLTDGEKAALEIFRKKNDALKALKEERQKQGSLYYQYQFGDQKDTAKATAARNRMTVLDGKITKASAEVLGIEDKKVLKDVLQKSRKVIEQHERKASVERVRAAREEARAKERQIANEKLEALRKKKNAQIAEVRAEEREKATERIQNVREGYQSSRLREKIKAFKAKLEKNLLKPTERQYVPAGLTQAMIDVVNLIDIDTDLINEDGTVNKAQERRNETKMKLSDLAAEYERLKASDPVYAGEFDEAVYNYLTELRDNFAGRHLREMTLSELTEMYEILRSIEETLQDARKLIGWGDAETVYEAGDSIIAEQNAITAQRMDGKRTWKEEKRDNSLALTLSPVRYVERMSGYHQSSYLLRMFKAFEKGIRKKNMFKMQAYKSFEALTSRQQYEDAMYNPAGKTYTDANGRSFRLSKMQMMQAILSLEREQANNMSHIEGSGFSFADLEMLKKGRLKDAISEEYSHRIPNAVVMVGDFVELLKNDKWAQDYMAAARKFFNETAKDAINETSLALKHRIVAKDKAYIPFEVDKNFIVNEISAANDVQQTINSYGMLKDTKKFASNPLIITGLNNILDRHIEQVGNIYGLAIEVRNFNKVWNVRGLEADSGDPTVKATIQRNWGDKGLKLVEQAVQDIQGPRLNSQSAIYKKIKSGYIGATFLLNLSVVTKQVGSLFSATSMLRWRGPVRQIGNLIYTMTHSKKLSAEVDKYTASAWMRRQGLSDAEVYTLMTEGKRTWMGRLASKAPAAVNPTKWITGMDHAVALSLWKYAKEDTAKRTGLKGEELLIATAEFYDELIENTQSMTDVLHRPEIQKKSDVISEAFGMFKTDLYQMAGQLLVSSERYQANKSKENGKALARTAYAVTMSAVWAQLMTAVFAALRYKVDQYRDDEDKDLTVESWMKRQGVALIGDFAGYIFPLIGSEAVGFLENIINDESDELVDSLGITAINNTYDAIINVFAPLADGELPKTSDLRKLTTNALQMFGVPANNILRTLDAIQLHAKDIANGKFLSFEAGVQRSSANHAHRIMEAVRKGDMDLANALFEEAVEESALKKSEDGSISDQALKDAQSALQTAFGKKYKDGEISAEQVEQILVDLFGKSEDDAYWTIKAWDNGGDSRYSAVFDAALSGTGFNEAVKEMTDHGYEKEDILSKLKTQVKTWYTDEESEVRISKQQATDMLKKYVGMNSDEVTSTINQWSSKVVTGIAYEDIKDEFLAGNITASRAIDMRVRYGGESREDAQKVVEGWNFEKKYSFSYSDRKNAYINGEVSASELRNAMITYGGMTAEEADENIRAYDWLKRNPKYDLSVSDVIAYTKPIADIGKSIEQAGINPDVYMQYKDLRSKCKGVDANGDGKTDSGSVKTEVLKAIDSLPISSSQKDALYYLNGWAKSKLWEAPWH